MFAFIFVLLSSDLCISHNVLCCCCCYPPTGKTNHGIHLFGRAIRHKDVLLCPIGAQALYLFYRFKISNEMVNPPDFTDNRAWFNIKLYTDGKPDKAALGIGPQRYSDAIKKVFRILGLPTKHTAHLGRILGPKKLEMLEMSQDEIRLLGNWDPKTQETTYSAKLPMRILRAMAGFVEAGGMHYNPRVGVNVPDCLTDAVFPWVKESKARLEAFKKERKVERTTATQFLRHMELMAMVFIQDVAAIKLLHPDRCENCLLLDDPLFRSDEFKVSSLVCVVLLFCCLNSSSCISLVFQVFMDDMAKALHDGEVNSPLKATVESVLPGVHGQFCNLQHEIKRVQDSLKDFKESMNAGRGRSGVDGSYYQRWYGCSLCNSIY